MAHTIIIGQTESGKSTLGKKLAAHYKTHKIARVVLDPMRDPGWHPESAGKNAEGFVMFDDPGEFLAYIKNPDQCIGCAIFIDEGGSMLNKYDKEFEWVTTQSRQHGHAAHIMTQRAQQISMTTRSQCSILYTFNINPDDAKIYAREFNEPVVQEAAGLQQGHFIRVQRFKPLQRGKLW